MIAHVSFAQMLHFKEHNQPAFDELAWAVRTGGNAWRKTHDGLSQFEWLQQDPKEEHKFSKAMQQVDGLGKEPPHDKTFSFRGIGCEKCSIFCLAKPVHSL